MLLKVDETVRSGKFKNLSVGQWKKLFKCLSTDNKWNESDQNQPLTCRRLFGDQRALRLHFGFGRFYKCRVNHCFHFAQALMKKIPMLLIFKSLIKWHCSIKLNSLVYTLTKYNHQDVITIMSLSMTVIKICEFRTKFVY